MPAIRIPYAFRRFTDNHPVFNSEEETISEILNDFISSYPLMQSVLFTTEGNLNEFVKLYVDGKPIEQKSDFHSVIIPEANITIITGIAGG